MAHAAPTLWLHPSHDGESCGGCATVDDAPRCRAQLSAEPCRHPRLAGRADQLALVMQALDRQVIEPVSQRGIVSLAWVKSLRIEGGEAELTVTFPPSCGAGQRLADAAFQALRGLLPDTDVYVRHDGA